MGLSPILPKIQSITIDTMVNNNGLLLNIGKNLVTYERSLNGSFPERPSPDSDSK